MAPIQTILRFSTNNGTKFNYDGEWDGVKSDYGVASGELLEGRLIYGCVIGVDQAGRLFSSDRSNLEWSKPALLPEKYKAVGHVSAVNTSDNRRLYVAYRGTDDGIYIIQSTNLKTWTELGRVGGKDAKTIVAPALAYTEEGLWLAGVDKTKSIYYTRISEDNEPSIPWTKVPGISTSKTISLARDSYNEYPLIFYAGDDGKTFFGQGYDPDEEKWVEYVKAVVPTITSGVAASTVSTGREFRGPTFCVAYRGKFSKLQVSTHQNYEWSDKTPGGDWITGEEITVSASDYGAYFSFATEFPDDVAARADHIKNILANLNGYAPSETMSEKTAWTSEKEVEEFNLKWQNPKESKSTLGRFFCC